ncbi:pyridoxal phosphate-dependent aminotransferase [Methanosphaerula palustris]|uniref:Histidinol-phosphate aminotransferase n=1 Tax=Methanosphaerula palustris (strain ATCC BAA-1556 / DSM 19958 / E1-9c) TaxID=521011 RepID=HIS8_METPE|nr:histidinol-phosphate transaminase [Methanosphaerula palustris]B8GIB0.1 RecName: Full=Histidinol-phosphate aminotransferase; AltName: Full=Imidazole acetol-phosphate transaminase [Methanosphaerula palustris E1-9c]ACL15461.1 histidinol-phosphate aminotransferase [Methanosphaerula palustris E1-9c]
MQPSIRSYLRTGPGYVYAAHSGTARETGRIACLASNENPFPPSEAAIAAGAAALATVNRYPDDRMTDLTEALKRLHGDHTFVVGNGMDGIIETVLRCFIGHGDRVVVSTPTFSFYGIAAAGQGAIVENIQRKEDFTVDIPAFTRACTGAKVAFLCTPNNPTGTVTTPAEVRKVLDGIGDCMLFLDNAYVDFARDDYRPLMGEYENLIIGRTMSKIFGLAGLRVGYAFIPAWLEPFYMKAATPFSGISSVSAAAAVAALADREHRERTLAHMLEWRERVRSAVRFPVLPSEANFLMIDVAPHTADDVVATLAGRGVLIRSCRSFPGLGDHYVRVSIGDAWENERFIEEINRI